VSLCEFEEEEQKEEEELTQSGHKNDKNYANNNICMVIQINVICFILHSKH
jgi:hypothetical protein